MKSSRDSGAQQLTSCNETGLPSLKKDLVNSLLLLRQCGANGFSLFDHLSSVIGKVIDERPPNVVDYFELFSERVRLESFQSRENPLESGYKEPDRLVLAKRLLPRLVEKSNRPLSEADEQGEEALEPLSMSEKDDEVIYYEPPARDLWELQLYWNLLGLGCAREEVSMLARALTRLNTNPALASCRFWGKLLGLSSDYYVIESTLTRSELENRIVCCIP
jgi:radial spoke head protein 4/6